MVYQWVTPIRYIRGLGPTRAKELIKIGIETVSDLLEYPPLSYIYPGMTPIADAKEGMVVIRAKVDEVGRNYNQTIGATLRDETGSCQAQWYSDYVAKHIRFGMTAIFYGKYKGGVLQQPKWTTVESSMENVYGGQYGVHHDTIRAALKEVLANVELPLMNDGGSRAYTHRLFHFPMNKVEQQHIEHRLKFDEALQLQLALVERRKGRDQCLPLKTMEWDNMVDAKLVDYFPYNFTDDQDDAATSIIEDMCQFPRYHPMQRLIHGEVGSGKTAVAFYAAMFAALNGKRTLILCPTTILAAQHFDTLKGMGWDDVVLQGRGGGDGKSSWYNEHIIIGTHALLNQPQLFKTTSLVIIDEFQKFGVEQRSKAQKHHPHLLMLSATPIPRTLAATVFGDLDVSVIRELPIKRGTVITKQVLPDRREGMYEIIERELARGKQAYFVYPRISGDEDVVSAERGFQEIQKRFRWDSSRLLTGRSKPEMKTALLQDFRDGYTKILVSTIIAEVGLDCPNATVMVIEGADRFGLSQLHQLRGRVCRSTDTAFCFLVSETANPVSIARLEVIEKCNCGFEIAEHDLRLRGPGEVFSTRQSGLPDLKWCSLVDDYDLMIKAKELVTAGFVGDGPKEMMRIKYDGLLQFGGTI